MSRWKLAERRVSVHGEHGHLLMHEEHRHLAGGEHFGRDRPYHQVVERGMAVASHHDQLEPAGSGNLDNLISGLTDSLLDLVRNIARREEPAGSGQQLLAFLFVISV